MLNFQGSTPVTGQPYPFQGMFRVEAQDDQGQPLPDVCVELEAHKADGMVSHLMTATRPDGGFPLAVMTPAGENSLFVVSAGLPGFGWRQAAAPPSFTWPGELAEPLPQSTPDPPLTRGEMAVFIIRAKMGCLHDQPDQSQFQILWGLTGPAGDPFAGAVLTMTISGPGVVQPFAVGTTDPNGQTQLISPINRFGHYDATVMGLTGPDGDDMLPSLSFGDPQIAWAPDGHPVIGFDVGGQCTPAWDP